MQQFQKREPRHGGGGRGATTRYFYVVKGYNEIILDYDDLFGPVWHPETRYRAILSSGQENFHVFLSKKYLKKQEQ
jgi:hypothetical protein